MNRYALLSTLYAIHHGNESVLSDVFKLKQKQTGKNAIVCGKQTININEVRQVIQSANCALVS